MKLNNIMIKSFIISSILFITPISTFAYTNKDISIDHIFTNEDGLWYPGRIESKDFAIGNNREEKIVVDRLSIELNSIKDTRNNIFLNESSKEFKELSKNSIVKLTYKGDILFEKRLDEIVSEDNIILSKKISINPNDKAVLNMTIDMLEEMNNDAQGLENIFNIGVSYKVDDTEIKPPVNSDDTIKPDTDVDGANKLPQTGGIINSVSLVALGTVAIGTGIVLNKKSEDKGEDKHNE